MLLEHDAYMNVPSMWLTLLQRHVALPNSSGRSSLRKGGSLCWAGCSTPLSANRLRLSATVAELSDEAGRRWLSVLDETVRLAGEEPSGRR
jgi:hypothetical protein